MQGEQLVLGRQREAESLSVKLARLLEIVDREAAEGLAVLEHGRSFRECLRKTGERPCFHRPGCRSPILMRTYVRVGGDDPARRSRRVLRVGRAAGRRAAPREAGDRRRRRRAGRELRGEGIRHPHGDGRPAGATAVPASDRRPAAHVRVLGGEQGGLRGVRGHDAARRGALDRRGVPRRPRAQAPRRAGSRHRGAAAAQGPRRGRAPDHGRDRADEVPGQGRERGGEAGRAARGSRRTASSRSCIRSRSSGCGAWAT